MASGIGQAGGPVSCLFSDLAVGQHFRSRGFRYKKVKPVSGMNAAMDITGYPVGCTIPADERVHRIDA
jgi:hypothetical protein